MTRPEFTIVSGEVRSGLAPTRTVLPNGVVVIAKETPTLPAVTISLAMRAGSVCDPVDAPGAVFLLSRVLDRGTATRSAADIAEDLDSRGITLTIAVTRHLLSLACTCLTEDFDGRVRAARGHRHVAVVPGGRAGIRKAEVITAIRQDEDNPAVRAARIADGAAVPGRSPLRTPTKGTVDGVEALTRERLVRLHAERFAPSELTAVVVGDVPAGRGDRRGGPRLRRLAGAAAGPDRVAPRRAGGSSPAARDPDDEQGAGRRGVRLHDHCASRSGLLRVLR